MKIETFSMFSGCLVLVLLPIIHISTLWFFWWEYHFPVDKSTCKCECWDTIFKGPYESGIASYKHLYFNATKNTLQIWIIIATGVIMFYESLKSLIELLLRGKLRFSMLVLYLSSIFPNYYSWWTFINYLNDGFYIQWNHQLFFSITEILSTITVLNMTDVHKECNQSKLFFIMGINTVHMIAGGMDQFVENVFLMQGAPHQVIRDVGFIIPDLLHIIIPIIEIHDLRKRDMGTKYWYEDKCLLMQILTMCVCVIVGCSIVVNL